MRADFHLHSTASDGRLEPAAIAAEAARRRLQAWALTDHDTMAGYREVAPSRPRGLVPGIELSCWFEGREVHVVSLGIDPDDGGMADLIAAQQERRRDWLERVVDHLAGLHPGAIGADELFAGRVGTTTRGNLAELMVARGLAADIPAAFAIIGDAALSHLPPPGYPAPATAADAVREAGGVALLAHPGHLDDLNLIERIVATGLDGIEARHRRLRPGMKGALDNLAGKKGWLVSCGSDTHQPGEPSKIGAYRLPRPKLAPLLRRLERWLDPARSEPSE